MVVLPLNLRELLKLALRTEVVRDGARELDVF
jgi:hypothetical protein